MNAMNPDDLVGAMRDALGEKLVALVLFGSRARGEARAESDWDVLLIAHDLPTGRLDRHSRLKRMVPASFRAAVSFLALTPEEFELPRYLPSYYLDLALDGRLLYDPDDFAGQRLGSIRQLIADRQLSRERTAAGDMWQDREASVTPLTLPWLVHRRTGDAG